MSEAVTPEQVKAFQVKGAELSREHGNFLERLAKLPEQGLDAHESLTPEIVKMGRPDIVLWLSTPEGREDAHALNNVKDDGKRTKFELERIAGKLARQGFGQGYEAPLNESDRYIQQRREAIRTGKRRVR
jgi:hypothetical protein